MKIEPTDEPMTILGYVLLNGEGAQLTNVMTLARAKAEKTRLSRWRPRHEGLDIFEAVVGARIAYDPPERR